MSNTPFLSEVMPDNPCPIPARSIRQNEGGVKARKPCEGWRQPVVCWCGRIGCDACLHSDITQGAGREV